MFSRSSGGRHEIGDCGAVAIANEDEAFVVPTLYQEKTLALHPGFGE